MRSEGNKSPKEKASELYILFFNLYPNQDAQFIAKEAALIAVEEIITNALNGIDLPSTWCNYWEQVKQEIQTF